MTADRILTETFAAHEHLAPDSEATLAEISHRLEDRRPAGRRLAAAGAAVTVVAVAVGAPLLLRGEPTPGGGTPAAPTASEGTAPADAKPPVVVVTVALDAGWLPAGRVRQVLASNSYGAQARGYDIVTPAGPLGVTLQTQPGRALPTENRFGVPRDVTVAGRPGREWSVNGWYSLALQLPDLRIGTVPHRRIGTVTLTGLRDTEDENRGAADLAAIGRRVAGQLRLDRPERIDTSYDLTYLPAGLMVRAVSASQARTSYSIATPTAPADKPRRSVELTQTTESWGTPQGKPHPPATPGRPVHGRPTWVHRTDAATTLFVDQLRPGASITLTSTAPDVTLAELYRIADGIWWTG